MPIRQLLPLVLLAACDSTTVVPQPGQGPYQEKTVTVDFPASDLPTEFHLESCLVDVDACNDLCQFLLGPDGLNAQIMKCDAQYDSDQVHVAIGWLTAFPTPTEGAGMGGAPTPN